MDDDDDDDAKPAAKAPALTEAKNLSKEEQLKLSISKIESNLEKADKALSKQKDNVKELE